eukprot:s3696_g4.t1
MSAAEYSRIIRDGRIEVAAERNRRGLDGVSPAAARVGGGLPPAGGAGGAVAPIAAAPAMPVQTGEMSYEADTLYWLAAESFEGVSFGDAIPGVIAAAVVGSKAVHTLPSGRAVFVECCYGRDRDQFLLKPSGWDFRCTPLALDSLGRPEVSLKDAAQKSCQKQVAHEAGTIRKRRQDFRGLTRADHELEWLNELPRSPTWIQMSFYPEVSFSPCLSGAGGVRSSLLPMLYFERHAHAAPSWIPSWSQDAGVPPVVSKSLQEDDHYARKVAWADEALWDEFRAPALRSFFNRALPETSTLVLPKGSSYTVSPSRFDSADVESEKIRALHDLVGLRLEVIPGAQLYEWDDKVENNSKLRMAVPCPPHADADADATSGEEDMLIHGELVPTSLRRLVVRAAGTQWHFDPQTGEEPVEIHEEQEEEQQLMHEYRFYIRRNLVRQQLAQSRSMLGEASPKLRASSATWAPGRVRFHAPAQPDWNRLDAVVAGGLRMPPALPYPVKAGPDGQRAQDPCVGWMLRSALKQNLFVLKPPGTGSHAQIFEQAVEQLNGRFGVGTDFFLVLQSSGRTVLPKDVRQQTLDNFSAFKADLEDLCFGRKDATKQPLPSPRSSVPTDDGGLDISEDSTGASFLVRRGCSTVYIRDTTLQTAFKGSRDWFELFYDDVFAPPKLFNFVIQWLVCSSTHMVHFVTSFTRIAEKHGFTLIRMPIAQLFPPPAPYWVFCNFDNDRETDFDRLAFYPRRKTSLPACSGDRTELFTKLLRAWLAPPLDFHFVYATQNVAFEVEEVKAPLREKSRELFQRTKGWILCDPDGLCLVALREETAYWYENRLLVSDARDPGVHEEKLERIEALRATFYERTDQILQDTQKRLQYLGGVSAGCMPAPPMFLLAPIADLAHVLCFPEGAVAARAQASTSKVSRQFFGESQSSQPAVVIKEDYTLAAVFSAAGIALCTLPYLGFGLGALVTLLGILFFVQAGRVRFVFDKEAFELRTLGNAEELEKPGENIVVGGQNRWKYSSFVNWEFFPKGLVEKGLPPILVYFKETQTPDTEWSTGPGAAANSPEALEKGALPGMVHFFPCICDAQQIKAEFERRGCKKL